MGVEVDWTERAETDLRHFAEDKAMAYYLLCFAVTELRLDLNPSDLDEGRNDDGSLYWRRAITRDDARIASTNEERPAWRLVFIYRPRNGREWRRHLCDGLVVTGIWTTGQLFSQYRALS